MKIGLVRHFKVNRPFPKNKLLSKLELIKWFAEYDNTLHLDYKKVDLGVVKWQNCYSSPMARALNTASYIYPGQIIEITALKELDILHQLPNRLKLPFLIWGLIVFIKSSFFNKDTDKFKKSIIAFLDKVIATNEGNTLIISHWFVMRVIRMELIKRGFAGGNFKSNEYGTLYIFECPENNKD